MRLLLLEDNPALLDAIASHLRTHGYAVDAFDRIAAAETALAVEEFGLALIDLALPDGDALGLLERMRRRGVRLPVIVMTARDQIRDRIRGLEAGADDYLVKPFDLDEMLARIKAVARRYDGNPCPLQAFGGFGIDRAAKRALVDGVDVQLTAKEWAVLEKLCSRPGTVFSREQLEQTLYGFGDEVGSNTLEVYVSRVRKKLGRDSIHTVRGLGYRVEEP